MNILDSKTLPEFKGIQNISSVPQRSPFRYAGGKTWLIPYIRAWLSLQGGANKELVEPFAGGGIVSITAVCENLVDRAIMVEKDEDVASVWHVILSDNAHWLADAIVQFDLTAENAKDAINRADESLEARAFATIIKNRLNRGGILADGASFIRNGENGKGLHSRWYPETLKKRILAINNVKDKILFIEGDGIEVYLNNSNRTDAVFFIDPPYYKASRRLYRYFDVDHEYIFDITSKVQGEFLMTYDNSEEIKSLASNQELSMHLVSMKTTHHTRKKELLIGSNLDWLF